MTHTTCVAQLFRWSEAIPSLAEASTVPGSAGTVEFAESLTWDFPVDVDAVQSLKDWCDAPIAALDDAIADATTARGQMEHQRARLVETVVEHLTNVISASEHAVSCLRSLHSALEDYAGAMAPIRTEFQAIITDATAAGLTVSQAGTQVTISHPADVPGGVGVVFASLRSRCDTNQKKFAYAESLFGDDLAAIDPTIWESTILAVFNRFVGTYGFPTGPNAAGGYPSWADTMRNTVGDTTEALYLQAKGATYEAPPGLRDASLWKQVTERGNLKNWKVPSVNAVEGGSRVVKAADALHIGGKVAGRACAVLDGAVSAYDSYQSDSYHHPEMGEGEKDSMGRCDRRCQRYRRVLGSHIWSTTRRSDRCRRRPRRHSCWRRNRRRYRRASGKQNWTKSSKSCQ